MGHGPSWGGRGGRKAEPLAHPVQGARWSRGDGVKARDGGGVLWRGGRRSTISSRPAPPPFVFQGKQVIQIPSELPPSLPLASLMIHTASCFTPRCALQQRLSYTPSHGCPSRHLPSSSLLPHCRELSPARSRAPSFVTRGSSSMQLALASTHAVIHARGVEINDPEINKK